MEENKLPLKRVELSLTKFNEVAIPHHLDLLRQHKANIIKYEDSGDYNRVRSEQTHARRVASQLRSLLGELDSLRRQVREEDCTKFDALTKRSRDLTLRAIMDYLEQPLAKPAVAGSTTSTESVGVLPQLQLQLEVDNQELELKAREEALAGWQELQTELRALHGVWQQLHLATIEQKEQVESVSSNIEVAAENVEVARAHLSYSERLRAGAYGLTGALIGACVAGPVGLTLGAKVAVTAALSASLAGFVGGKMIGHRRQLQLEQGPSSQPQEQTQEANREVKDKDE